MRQRAHQVGNKTRGTARLVTYKPEDNKSAYLETNPVRDHGAVRLTSEEAQNLGFELLKYAARFTK
jgi:hypothetical protein